ncbi:MAG TPA: MerR family transcriptional regulator [Candidatus Babeliaceae bacterium]|nr:MerR family transcriptional regulator [Candidatus Babeliaceae bacterium]
MVKRKKGYFSISAVAKMFSVHQQTIRLYEKEGLISPKRSEGNTRLFAEEDVDRLEEIIYLTHTLGINLAGVEMILKLQKQIKKLQKEMNMLFKTAHDELSKESIISQHIIKNTAQRLYSIKKDERVEIKDFRVSIPEIQNNKKESCIKKPKPSPLLDKENYDAGE